MEALKPISGDYGPLPRPIIYPVLPNDPVWIKLMTGFTYQAVGGPGTTGTINGIWTLTPGEKDFEFDVWTP
jgi:hypothetical protein